MKKYIVPVGSKYSLYDTQCRCIVDKTTNKRTRYSTKECVYTEKELSYNLEFIKEWSILHKDDKLINPQTISVQQAFHRLRNNVIRVTLVAAGALRVDDHNVKYIIYFSKDLRVTTENNNSRTTIAPGLYSMSKQP